MWGGGGIMRHVRCCVILVVLVALAATSPALASGERKHVRVSVYGEGHAYCPPRNVVIGNIAVRGGRCYQVAVVRNTRGAFLTFLDPTIAIPTGRLERLDGDEGRSIRGHILYFVPLPMTNQLLLIPLNTVQLIRLREEDEEDEDDNEHIRRGNLVVIVPNAPTPNVSVAIVVTF
jgi:hypothetical protein